MNATQTKPKVSCPSCGGTVKNKGTRQLSTGPVARWWCPTDGYHSRDVSTGEVIPPTRPTAATVATIPTLADELAGLVGVRLEDHGIHPDRVVFPQDDGKGRSRVIVSYLRPEELDALGDKERDLVLRAAREVLAGHAILQMAKAKARATRGR